MGKGERLKEKQDTRVKRRPARRGPKKGNAFFSCRNLGHLGRKKSKKQDQRQRL